MGSVFAEYIESCGSAACLAGHAGIQAREDGETLVGPGPLESVAQYHGLSPSQADALVAPVDELDYRRRSDPGAMDAFTPAMGARVLLDVAAVASMGSAVSAQGILMAWSEALDILGAPGGEQAS